MPDAYLRPFTIYDFRRLLILPQKRIFAKSQIQKYSITDIFIEILLYLRIA